MSSLRWVHTSHFVLFDDVNFIKNPFPFYVRKFVSVQFCVRYSFVGWGGLLFGELGCGPSQASCKWTYFSPLICANWSLVFHWDRFLWFWYRLSIYHLPYSQCLTLHELLLVRFIWMNFKYLLSHVVLVYFFFHYQGHWKWFWFGSFIDYISHSWLKKLIKM